MRKLVFGKHNFMLFMKIMIKHWIQACQVSVKSKFYGCVLGPLKQGCVMETVTGTQL